MCDVIEQYYKGKNDNTHLEKHDLQWDRVPKNSSIYNVTYVLGHNPLQ